MKDRIKKQMNDQLNALLGLSIDWSLLKRADLEAVHRALIEQLTVPRAMRLHATAFRARLDSMPVVSVLRERMQVLRQDYEKSHPTIKYRQQPGIPVLQMHKGIQPSLQGRQKRIRQDYVC